MRTISEKLNHMSEFLSSQDLVDLGIYKSIDSAYLARMRSNSPSFIKLKHRVLYPKQAVIEFLEQRMRHKTNDSTNTHLAESRSEKK